MLLNAPQLTVFYIFVVLGVLTETMAISFLKTSVTRPQWIAAGLAAYVLVALLYREVLSFGPMALANALWTSLSLLLVSFVGITFRHETYTPLEYTGIGLAFCSSVCMLAGKRG